MSKVHLGSKELFDMVATESDVMGFSGKDGSSHVSLSIIVFSSMKGGFVGGGSSSSFFVSICNALDIFGRKEGASCMHNSPIWMTLKTSFLMLPSR